MISPILNALGLMTRAEHERALNAVSSSHNHWQSEARKFEAKFKLAATDLAKQAEEIEAYKQDADRVQHMLNESEKLVSALTDKNVELVGKLETARGERDAAMADALLWRNARDKRAKKRGGK